MRPQNISRLTQDLAGAIAQTRTDMEAATEV